MSLLKKSLVRFAILLAMLPLNQLAQASPGQTGMFTVYGNRGRALESDKARLAAAQFKPEFSTVGDECLSRALDEMAKLKGDSDITELAKKHGVTDIVFDVYIQTVSQGNYPVVHATLEAKKGSEVYSKELFRAGFDQYYKYSAFNKCENLGIDLIDLLIKFDPWYKKTFGNK